jgi:hypothetical protein
LYRPSQHSRPRASTRYSNLPCPVSLLHPSDIELQRIADEGDVAGSEQVLAHIRQCLECAEVCRYSRAIHAALQRSLPDETPPEDLLARVLSDVADPTATASGVPIESSPDRRRHDDGAC